MQPVRGLIVGTLVGATLAAFVMTTLHATTLVGLLGGAGVGLSVFAVVSTKSDAGDEAADAAWRAASLDLPPVSDRLALERLQERLPGPGEKRRSLKRPGPAHPVLVPGAAIGIGTGLPGGAHASAALPSAGTSPTTETSVQFGSGASPDAASSSSLPADPGVSVGQGAQSR